MTARAASAATEQAGIRGRVFVVGCPRSGTTLLQALLAGHSSITSFPETHFYWLMLAGSQREQRLFGRAPGSALARLRRRAAEWMLRAGLAPKREGAARLPQILREIGREDLVAGLPGPSRRLSRNSAALVAALDRDARDRGASVWVEKTPHHYGCTDLIARLVPGARFVHIVRDGRDVVASMVDARRRYPDEWTRLFWDADRCADAWLTATRAARAARARPDHAIVRYEDLIANPEGELRRLCGFIGVQFEPDMLTAYRGEAATLFGSSEPWKEGVRGPIQAAEHKFDRLFEGDERERLLARLAAADIGAHGTAQDAGSREGTTTASRER